jgi:hypothetical protein
MSCGTTTYTATGTTTIVRTNVRRTGLQLVANGAIAKKPTVTSGKMAIQVINALTWTDGGFRDGAWARTFVVDSDMGMFLSSGGELGDPASRQR